MNAFAPLLTPDSLGWLAAGLTLLSFTCRDMRRLRLLALAANAAFIVYGATAGLLPVMALHLALVPVNLWRLSQTMRAQPTGARPALAAAAPVARRQPRGWRPAPRARRPRARAVQPATPVAAPPAVALQ